jgi:hypothetical protein
LIRIWCTSLFHFPLDEFSMPSSRKRGNGESEKASIYPLVN